MDADHEIDDPPVEGVLASSILETIEALVLVLDRNARIVFLNKACERLTGWTLAQVRGRVLWELGIEPAQMAALKAIVSKLVDGHAPTEYTDPWRTATGECRLIHWLHTSITGPEGAVRYVIGTGIDVTERDEAERRLAEREERLRSIMQTAPDGIITIDQAGVIDSVNPATETLFGYTAQELVGKNVEMLMPSPYREAHDSHVRRYLETGERRIIGIGRVVVGRRKDGTTFPAHLAVGEIELADRRLFTGFLHDISEREIAERRAGAWQQELMHASRLSAVGEMATGIAHELNQPLTAIVNYARAAQRRLDRDRATDLAQIVDLLDKTAQQADRAAEIVRRLRSFIKREDTERALESINRVVEEASALALIGTKDRNVEFVFALGEDLPPVLIDRIQIQQVVLNILRNAIEAFEGPGDRRVVITTSRHDGLVFVEIEDNGPGLAPSVAGNPFQPFQTTKEDGIGIGLAISRTIIDAHGGQLTAESSTGGGARFRFSLPIEQVG